MSGKVDLEEHVRPLDNIYAINEYQRHKSRSKSAASVATLYNRWRASLPEHCWSCVRYDRCYPGFNCKWNNKEILNGRT